MAIIIFQGGGLWVRWHDCLDELAALEADRLSE
jgi:hypothetical protein